MPAAKPKPTQFQVTNPKTNKRTTVRPGVMTKATLATVTQHARRLSHARRLNVPIDEQTAAWLAGVGDDLRGRLAAAGLCDPPRSAAKLGAFWDQWAAGRDDVKDSTATTYSRAKKHVVIDYFGSLKPLAEITPERAREFDRYLRRPKEQGGAGLRDNTARGTIKVAKQVFAAAVDAAIISASPFKGIASATKETTFRRAFITEAVASDVLDALPTTQWRLLFALARWGGLRVGSEPRALMWEHVGFDRGTFKVIAAKKQDKQGEGDADRTVPIFRELRPLFERAYEERDRDDPRVLPFLTPITDQALRKTLLPTIRRAGHEPWPKPWQNLRSTRETELIDQGHPMHVVCAWIGNSPEVAMKHYLQVHDAHYAAAVANGADDATARRTMHDAMHRVMPVAAVMQNPMQQAAAADGTAAQEPRSSVAKPHPAAPNIILVGDTGLEPVTSRV